MAVKLYYECCTKIISKRKVNANSCEINRINILLLCDIVNVATDMPIIWKYSGERLTAC